jgi:hypothetical protein
MNNNNNDDDDKNFRSIARAGFVAADLVVICVRDLQERVSGFTVRTLGTTCTIQSKESTGQRAGLPCHVEYAFQSVNHGDDNVVWR